MASSVFDVSSLDLRFRGLVGTLRKPSLFAASCCGGLRYITAELCRVALMLFLAKLCTWTEKKEEEEEEEEEEEVTGAFGC